MATGSSFGSGSGKPQRLPVDVRFVARRPEVASSMGTTEADDNGCRARVKVNRASKILHRDPPTSTKLARVDLSVDLVIYGTIS